VRRALVLTLMAGLATAAPASAGGGYPPPGDPGKVQGHPKGKLTLRVCKRYRKLAATRYRSIQKAIDYAGPGDTIRVCHGVYRGGVQIQTRRKRSIRLIGDPKHPRRVVIDLKGAKGIRAQNGVFINRANDVTVSGFYARNYRGNGFFALSVTGYTLKHLVAAHGGTYGVYAFDSKGGTMTDSEAYYNNDSGFYIGQTPPQRGRKLRSLVSRVRAWGNVIGFSGTNMRYVTITRSKWFNNGLGIVPNALRSERYAPPDENTIIDNDIFWNNFNYYLRAPFPLKPGAAGHFGYPVGTGVLLFGGRHTTITKNRIYGNYLGGVGAVQQILLAALSKQDEPSAKKRAFYKRASELVGNKIYANAYGLGGNDPNGHDVAYEGSGRQNCVSEPLARNNVGGPFPACPFGGANTLVDAARAQMLTWSTDLDAKKPATREKYWTRVTHPPIKGITPLEHCRVVRGGCAGQPRR
jgi:hypothetical protein